MNANTIHAHVHNKLVPRQLANLFPWLEYLCGINAVQIEGKIIDFQPVDQTEDQDHENQESE